MQRRRQRSLGTLHSTLGCAAGGLVLCLAGCSPRATDGLDRRAISDTRAEPVAPAEAPPSAETLAPSAEPAPPLPVTPEAPVTELPLQRAPAASCLREAEFVRLGAIPANYLGSWRAIDPASRYVVWTHSWGGNDNRMQSFHWSPEGGITAIDERDPEVYPPPDGVDVDQFITKVSGDGSVVVGARFENDTYAADFRWTVAGRQQLLDFSPAVLSRDGAVALGVRAGSFVRWSETGGTQPLAGSPAPAPYGVPLVSDGGDVIAGNDAAGRSFRWTEASGSTDLGQLAGGSSYTRVQFMNAAGDVLTGLADDPATGQAHLFRWTPGAGLQDLVAFPSATVSLAQVSADARVVVADVLLAVPDATHTFRWTEAQGLQDLTPEVQLSHAVYLSPKGDVVIGQSNRVAGDELRSFRWSEATGTQSLAIFVPPDAVGAGGNLLISNTGTGPSLLQLGDPGARGPLVDLIPPGIVPAGWSEPWLEGLSEDGGLLAGSALNPEGVRESWLLRARERCQP